MYGKFICNAIQSMYMRTKPRNRTRINKKLARLKKNKRHEHMHTTQIEIQSESKRERERKRQPCLFILRHDFWFECVYNQYLPEFITIDCMQTEK